MTATDTAILSATAALAAPCGDEEVKGKSLAQGSAACG
jgi:hypothetical protein